MGVPIIITGLTGSLTVIAVNGWMNDPTGFSVVAGRVTDIHPWQALFNDNLAHELVHMYLAGYMVAGFLVAGVYARRWLKGDRDRYVRVAMAVPLTVAALAGAGAGGGGRLGGAHGGEEGADQAGGVRGAPEDHPGRAVHDRRRVRGRLDQVRHQGPEAALAAGLPRPERAGAGARAVPKRDRPPVNVVHFSFQTMVAIGTAMALLGAIYLVTVAAAARLPRSRWFYRAVVAAGPLALVALIAGWITTEVGRQPWMVYKVMRTSQAVTEAGGLWVGYAVLVVVYVMLGCAVVWLLRRLARQPAESEGG